MNAIIPYVFFLYMFILTWIIMLNYPTIEKFTNSKLTCISFISITISLFVFVGVATLYHFETKDDEFKDKIKDVTIDLSCILG